MFTYCVAVASGETNEYTCVDSSSTGLTRTNAPLRTTLPFSNPLMSMISSRPGQKPNIMRDLKKTHRVLSHRWAVELVLVTVATIEVAFMDVFSALKHGGRWVEIEGS